MLEFQQQEEYKSKGLLASYWLSVSGLEPNKSGVSDQPYQ